MKISRFTNYILAIIAAMTVSCEKEPMVVDNQFFDDEEITVNKPAFSAKDYIINLKASATVAWKAVLAENLSWITLDVAQGKGDGKIAFSLEENDGISARTAKVVVSAVSETTSFAAEKIIYITQIGTAPVILISPSGRHTVLSSEQDIEVEVTSNVKWKASLEIDGDWAEITDGAAGDGQGVTRIHVSETDVARSFVLHYTSDEYPEAFAELAVSQILSYTIRIDGEKTGLGESTGIMKLISESGDKDIDARVEMSESSPVTEIKFDEQLPAGEYQVVSYTPEAGSVVALGIDMTIGEMGIVAWNASYNPELELFGGETEEHPIRISSFEDIKRLQASVNGGKDYSGRYFLQTKDITVAEKNWSGIGNADGVAFSGSFDGASCKFVFDLEEKTGSGVGLFNHVKGADAGKAVIKNVATEGTIVSTAAKVCGIVYKIGDNTKIDNCSNRASIIANGVNGQNQVAGCFSEVNGVDILVNGCNNYGQINLGASSKVPDSGGVIGVALSSQADGVEIRNCSNYGNCIFMGNSGGVVGTVKIKGVNIIGCANYGTVTTKLSGMRVGAVAGSVDVSGDVYIQQCFNLGLVNAAGNASPNTGAVVGFAKGQVHVLNCYNRGKIELDGSKTNIGGILGHMNNVAPDVKWCYTSAEFVSTKDVDVASGAVVGTNLKAGVPPCVIMFL